MLKPTCNSTRPRLVLHFACCVLATVASAAASATLAAEPYTENPGTEGNGNFVVGPDYKTDPDLTDRGNPKGKQFEFTMRLADSKIFPGTDATLDKAKPVREVRKITVYVPAAYKDGHKAPILVTFDGPSRLNLVRNALDNLTISQDPSRRLPAFIVIAVENGGNDGKGSQRGLEYDTMSDRHARFISDEVLPAVLNNAEVKAAFPHIAFTDNPWGRGVMGCSSGGAAALTAGWFRPDLFRRLVTYSGTFVDQQDDDAAEEADYPLGAWEYHSGKKLIENSDKKPLRIFTHVAENDLRANDPEETYHNWVMANERTAAALKVKGYDYRYVFSKSSRHCDGRVFESTLADTLVWMWRGYHDEQTAAASKSLDKPTGDSDDAAADNANAAAAEPIAGGQRVFTCGHSFHVWVPGIVADLAKKAEIAGHEQLGVSSIGGSRVIQHWDIADDKNKAKATLATGKADVLTLSPIFLPDAGIENFTTLALEHNPSVRVIVQPIWLRWDIYEPTMKRPATVDHNAITGEELRKRHAEHFQKIDDHVRDLNTRYGKTVLYIAPAPQALIALREKIIAGEAPGLKQQEDLFTDALGHGTVPLKVLVSYVNYATIYRRSPIGLPVPEALKQANLGNQEEPLNRLLQQLAWTAARAHPLSGVTVSDR